MMALRAHSRGGPERLVYETAPDPMPGPGEVLVAVHAASITYEELGWDLSWTRLDGTDRTPVIPSHETSGTVAALGDGVTGLSIGDEVYGLIDFDRDGAAADFTTASAATLAGKPRSVSHAEASALPLAALTAWQALVDHAGLTAGERLLVLGGAGGVGVYAVQIGAGLGAHVTATGFPGQVDTVTALGAERFVDAGDFPGTLTDVDVVLDTVGGQALTDAYGVLRRGGRLVTLGAPPPAGLAEEYGVHAMFFVVQPDRRELETIAQMVDAGRLRPVVGAEFPLADGRAAFTRNDRPRRGGKTVLLVRADRDVR